MNTTGDTGDHLDPDLDAYQTLGVIPASVLARLWPGFVPQDNEVSIDPACVRRHVQKAPEHVRRVASFARHAHELPRLFARATAFARCDGVKEGEAGLSVYAPVGAGDESPRYLAIGVKRRGMLWLSPARWRVSHRPRTCRAVCASHLLSSAASDPGAGSPGVGDEMKERLAAPLSL